MNFAKSVMFGCTLLFATSGSAEPASIADLAWLEGTWEGIGINGAPAMEVYSAAADDQMVGHFRQLKPDGSVMFFELITIGKRDGVVTYSLKHFNPDLTGWEERKTVRHFPLTNAQGNSWTFSGIVYERTGPESMTVGVATKGDGGDAKSTFQYKRVKQ